MIDEKANREPRPEEANTQGGSRELQRQVLSFSDGDPENPYNWSSVGYIES